jgi:zinc transporter
MIWGFDFASEAAASLLDPELADGEGHALFPSATPPGAFRWLHLNITDQTSCRWIEGLAELPALVRELLLSPDTHQRALVEDDVVACVLHDVEVDFGKGETARMGALRFALSDRMMVTARHHPLYAADVVKRRIDSGLRPKGPAEALDLLVSGILQVASKSAVSLV